MKKIDWIIHNIVDNPISYHTHGLHEVCEYELEIVLPISPEKASEFLHCIADKLIDGYKIEDGLLCRDMFNMPIYFFKVQSISDETKTVYRVIFPDEKGFYPWTIFNGLKCDENYINQIEFDTVKVFFIVLKDKLYSSHFFEFEFFKKGNEFVAPIQYLIPNVELVRLDVDNKATIESCILNSIIDPEYFKHFKIVCQDLDKEDTANKAFVEWVKDLSINDIIYKKVFEEGV